MTRKVCDRVIFRMISRTERGVEGLVRRLEIVEGRCSLLQSVSSWDEPLAARISRKLFTFGMFAGLRAKDCKRAGLEKRLDRRCSQRASHPGMLDECALTTVPLSS